MPVVALVAALCAGCANDSTAHWAAVEFNDVRVRVPPSWVVRPGYQEECQPRSGIHVGGGSPPESCPPPLHPATDLAHVGSLFSEGGFSGLANARRKTVNGQPVFVTEGLDKSQTVVLPWLNYRLDVGAKQRGLARRIANSVTPVHPGPQPGGPDVDATGARRAHVAYVGTPDQESTYATGAEVTDAPLPCCTWRRTSGHSTSG